MLEAAILAGGMSRRYGSDKALIPVAGTVLVQRLVENLRREGFEPFVVTAEGRDYAFLDCRIERDIVSGRGPLAGLWTALERAVCDPLAVVTCDMPASAPLLRPLAERHVAGSAATVYAGAGGRPEPFPGIYGKSLIPLLIERLNSDDLSMTGLLRACGPRRVPAGAAAAFANINTPKDWEQFGRRARPELLT